jgi:exodeoxyribonuclease VII small subunit
MPQKPFHFEAALTELEQITQWFESSDADLDAGLQKFERGMELAAQLKDHLKSVENRVEKIKARFGETRPQAAPSQMFEDDATDLLD